MRVAAALAMLCLTVPLVCSCRPVRKANRIEVVAIARVVDRNQPDHDMCSTLTMSKADVVRYFALADVVDAGEFHDQAIILPCKYQGSIRMGGHVYQWEIFAGGAGYLYDGAAVNKRYVCRERCLAALPNLQ